MSPQNRAEQVIIAQYLKSDCFLSLFLVIKHVKRTNISPEINRSAPKMSLNMLYYQERAQKAVGFWKLCSFDSFCSILMAHLAIFWKYNMFKDTLLVVFGCDLLISGEIFALKHVVLPIKCPKCRHILNIVQFWPILLNSDGLFGHFFLEI